MKITAPLTDAGRVRMKTEKYYGRYIGVDGKWTRAILCETEVASQQMLADIVRRVELEKLGVVDHFQEHRTRPINEHVEDFKAFLVSKGNTAAYANKTTARIKAIVDGCGFKRIDKVNASAVVEWLAAQRQVDALSITTSNYYLRDAKTFFRWLVQDRRTSDNQPKLQTGRADRRL